MDLILLAVYTANLIAFLTISKTSLPANNLEQLASQKTHRVGVMGGSSHEAVFKVSPNNELHPRLPFVKTTVSMDTKKIEHPKELPSLAHILSFSSQTAESGYYHDVWNKIIAVSDNRVHDPLEGVVKAQQENYIYVTEVSSVHLQTKRPKQQHETE